MRYLIFLHLIIFLTPFALNGQVMTKQDTYSIPLDESSGIMSSNLQFFQIEKKRYLAIGYGKATKINVYDFDKQSLIKTFQFEKEGPDGVGGEIRGFFIENLDKVYVNGYWKRKIFLLNGNSKVIDKFSYNQDEEYPSIEPTTFCPITVIDNYLYCSGNLMNHRFVSRHQPMSRINLLEGYTSLLGESPEITQKANFYPNHQLKYTYIEDQEKFVLSFNVSDSLYVSNFQNSRKAYYAKSKFIESIDPISYDKKFEPPSKERMKYNLIGQYKGILYDKYRKYYYRIGAKTMSIEEYKENRGFNYFLMVFDENFNLLGEVDLPGEAAPILSFITEKGLYIANKNAYFYEDESEIKFDIYTLNN